MGIPTTREQPRAAKASSQTAEGAGIPMKGEMSRKFQKALNDFKDIYGDESGGDQSGDEQDDTNGTGIKLQ